MALPYDVPIAELFSLDKDHTLKRRLDKIGLSNGMAWTSDKTTMFYTDSIARKIYSFDFDITTGDIGVYASIVRVGFMTYHFSVQKGNKIDFIFYILSVELGTIHNCQLSNKCTKHTLSHTPLPSPLKKCTHRHSSNG